LIIIKLLRGNHQQFKTCEKSGQDGGEGKSPHFCQKILTYHNFLNFQHSFAFNEYLLHRPKIEMERRYILRISGRDNIFQHWLSLNYWGQIINNSKPVRRVDKTGERENNPYLPLAKSSTGPNTHTRTRIHTRQAYRDSTKELNIFQKQRCAQQKTVETLHIYFIIKLDSYYIISVNLRFLPWQHTTVTCSAVKMLQKNKQQNSKKESWNYTTINITVNLRLLNVLHMKKTSRYKK